MRNFSFRDEIKASPPPPNRHRSRLKHSAQRGDSWWSKIFSKVRATIIFLLLATIATVVLAHLNEIHAIAAAKARSAENTIQKDRDQDPLRQAALNYEKHVEAVGTGQKP